ncbi:hypothetical protein AB0D04_37705 [Streptomyces sp. NPDC048483]|uniref:hypothetical protein n=1 Tax=Streptomyces sp. NPDC048483 TaxID=3154927 RepID=UPI00342BF15C
MEGTAAYGRAQNAAAQAEWRRQMTEETVTLIEGVGGWDAWVPPNREAAPDWIEAWREHGESPEALEIRSENPRPAAQMMARIEDAGSWRT